LARSRITEAFTDHLPSVSADWPCYGQVAAIIFMEFTLRYAIPTESPFIVDLLRVS
jgi:hypothetical protein